MEVMDKISEELKDEPRRHNSKILYRHADKLKGNSQSRLVPVTDRNETGPQLEIREVLKRDGRNILNFLRVQGARKGLKCNVK